MPTDHDSLLLAAADALAAWLHRDDVDKQGEPLIGHCRRVAAALKAEGWPAEVQAAGLLHDTLEAPRRCGLSTLHHLTAGTADLVYAVTRFPEEAYDAYVEGVRRRSPAAIALKLADLRDNLDPSRPIPGSLRKRYERAVEVLTGKNVRATAVLTAEQAGEEG